MAGQNKASMRRKLRSALAHKRLADELLAQIAATQTSWNAALAKLDADTGGQIAAVAATALLDLTADITLTSVAAGAARNTTTLTLEVEAAAANPTDTILADFTGTAAAIVVTITPNDGTNNAATPVDLTTAELRELITTGAVVGKTVTITDAGSLRTLQTATGGGATALADAGEGDGVVATFSGGVNVTATGLDTNYAATQALTTSWDPDASLPGQHKASARNTLRSALAHRRMADELADALAEFQAAYSALLVKLDAEAGTLSDGNYESTLGVAAIDPEDASLPAQHKAKMRRSLRAALANTSLADSILDAIAGMQASLNSALAALDDADILGNMAALQVAVIDPDAE